MRRALSCAEALTPQRLQYRSARSRPRRVARQPALAAHLTQADLPASACCGRQARAARVC